MIRRSIMVLWLMVLVVVCLPFVGFGLYYDEKCGRCKRYKLATKPLDKAYAYVYMAFGILLCLCLVVCNVAVMKALVLTKQSMLKRKAVLVRRISRNKDLTLSSSTSEETAFAKIMALFCLTFVVCWLPQLITVPLGMMYPGRASSEIFFKVADGLLAAHFIADPYLYILQRWPLFRQFCRRGKGSRVNSVKTSNELCSL
ncbi:hypothetical protein AAG570_008735 [Ranatra chinensis]|uniref:G-protein coupled receptors family 1 profile domain-containing protein n=1 Tax=Ranatra chinensis TaxID=642074 RepID=A0ABD0Z8W5_9HEMI